MGFSPSAPPTYIHELEDWPNFTWNGEKLAPQLAKIHRRQGELLGRMQAFGMKTQSEAALQTLTSDVIKTSEIEGERLDAETVRSSVARHLGLDFGGLKPADRNVEGIVEVTLNATMSYAQPLTAKRLFSWQAALFPNKQSGLQRIVTGTWRKDTTEPMQVISGALGREQVHFEAPGAKRLPQEMDRFLTWFERTSFSDSVARAALAHFWFVTIHPFEDGNGRIARAIADLALARADGTHQRFYSMSTQIQEERAVYYRILETTQKGGSMDITPWMEWFLGCLDRAIGRSICTLESVLRKSRFWQNASQMSLNERQRTMLGRLLDGFEGKLTTSKYAKLCKCSQDSALRDMQSLTQAGLLQRNAEGGRSTNYTLILPSESEGR